MVFILLYLILFCRRKTNATNVVVSVTLQETVVMVVEEEDIVSCLSLIFITLKAIYNKNLLCG